MKDEWLDPELGWMSTDLKVDARCLSQNLHVFPSSWGPNRELWNWFQLVEPDPEGIHRLQRDDIGEGVPAVDVGSSLDVAQSNRYISTVVARGPCSCLDLSDDLVVLRS